MQIIKLELNASLNASLQKGDTVYYSPLSPVANSGFEQAITGNIIKLGIVVSIYNSLPGEEYIHVIYDEATVTPPAANDYIMFEKNKYDNSSNLTGYYAEVQFKNYSQDKVELFSISSEVSESSK